MKTVIEETCERAWLTAAEHLAEVSGHAEYNMVVEIAKPTLHGDEDRRVRHTVDGFLRSRAANPITTVAGTIFPAADYKNHGARGVYEVYPDETYPQIKSEWGRYAYRLVRWPADTPTGHINPLQKLVEKINTQRLNGMRLRGCYEVSLTDSAIDLPLYDPMRDRGRTRGGPCLSHLSFKLGVEDTLYLTALYRSHSYIARALGNFLGLADLQAFVCDETGLAPGPLMCVSSYARLEPDKEWSVGEAIELVKRARVAYSGDADEAA